MALSRNGNIAAALAIAFAVGLAVDGARLLDTLRYNQHLRQGDVAAVAADNSVNARFARAWIAHKNASFEEASKAYAQVNAVAPDKEAAVRFNTANLYLEQARALQELAGADNTTDLALPLVELAKENYRTLLRADAGHWPARYNLERALLLAPERREEELPEDIMPERSQRAPTAAPVLEELP